MAHIPRFGRHHLLLIVALFAVLLAQTPYRQAWYDNTAQAGDNPVYELRTSFTARFKVVAIAEVLLLAHWFYMLSNRRARDSQITPPSESSRRRLRRVGLLIIASCYPVLFVGLKMVSTTDDAVHIFNVLMYILACGLFVLWWNYGGGADCKNYWRVQVDSYRARPPRRWYRFNLKEVLVAMVVLSFAGGYVTRAWSLVRERKAALAQLEKQPWVIIERSNQFLGSDGQPARKSELSFIRRWLGDEEIVILGVPQDEVKPIARIFPEAAVMSDWFSGPIVRPKAATPTRAGQSPISQP